MTPPPIADRILLFGRDALLLETRALVLRSAGMVVDVALDIDQFRLRIADHRWAYEMVVCCYTANEAECREIIDVTHREGVGLIKLECFVSPEKLIHQVSDLVQDRHSRIDGAKNSPSI